MKDETPAQQPVAAVLSGVAKKTVIVASVGVVASLVVSLLQGGERWWLFPLGVLFGAGLGLLNFRWLAIAVQRVYLRQGATASTSNVAAVIINVLKLTIIFIVLFIVIKWRFLPVFGVVAGLSFCFLAIIWEGATMMKKNAHTHDK